MFGNTVDDDTKAIALNPRFAAAYQNRGIAYSRRGQYDEAIEDFNAALSIRPSFMEAYSSRGFAYIKKAEDDYKKACDLGDNNACKNLKQLSEK